MSSESSGLSSFNVSYLEQKYWIPGFLDLEVSIKGEYYPEWCQYLKVKNEEQMEDAAHLEPRSARFQFYSKHIFETVLELSKFLQQPPEVRYLTMDIYDRFMMKHTFDVIDKAHSYGNFEEKWPQIRARLDQQALLRILTCMQFASKLACNAKVISAANAETVLRYFEINYDKKSVRSSENRVYKTLDFKLPTVTPLTYIEMLLEDLSFTVVANDMSGFLKLCVNILDTAFYQHLHIYLKLFWVKTGKCIMSKDDKQKFAKIEGDFMLLAASVVRTATIVIDPTNRTANTVNRHISYKVNYSQQDIELLSTILLENIIQPV